MNRLLAGLLVLALVAGSVSAVDHLVVVDHATYMPANTTANFTTNIGNWSQNYTLYAYVNYSGESPQSWWFAVDFNMPYGFQPYRAADCNGSGGFRPVNYSRDPYGMTDYNSRVACQINYTDWNANFTNVSVKVTANVSALSDVNTTVPTYFWINLTTNATGFGANNVTVNSTPAAHYRTDYYVNPRPYAYALNPESSTNATFWITGWNQTRATYSMDTPIMAFNQTSKRPEARNNSVGALMYMPGSMMERPSYNELWTYNLTFSLRNMLSSNDMLFRICSPVNNSFGQDQTLMPILIRNETQWDFFTNESFNMTIGVPSQSGFTIQIGNLMTNSSWAAENGLNMTFRLDDQSDCANGGLFMVNTGNATLANNTDVSVFLTMQNITAGQYYGESSPIYVGWQNIGGGFGPGVAPAFGQNITYEYTASILNLLDNYTLNNLTIRFFLPENVTPFMSGTPNTSTFNISSNMGMYWNESDGVGNWTYDGVAVRTNCTNQTDKMPGSPNYNGIMMMCLRIYELQLVSASFGNWLPHSDASNVTLKFNATMSFPALEENANTPASVGSSNYYNASFSSSVQTNLDLTAKVPGIASAGCANTVVILDGQTLTCNSNYTLGSLTLLNTGSGSHSLSVSYSIPAITGVGGGTTQDCGSCALDGVCRSCCASDPDCPAGATPAPTPAGAGVPTPTVLEITPTPSVSAGETPTETSSEETGAETPSTELSSANAYIRDARTGMLDAQVKGYDVSDVQRLIGLAEQARDGGDYALAKQYAQQAQDLVSAKMSAQLQKAGAADWMPIAAVLAVLVIGGAWYFFGRKK